MDTDEGLMPIDFLPEYMRLDLIKTTMSVKSKMIEALILANKIAFLTNILSIPMIEKIANEGREITGKTAKDIFEKNLKVATQIRLSQEGKKG